MCIRDSVCIALAAVLMTALGATSSYWFCGGFCHSVQLDAVKAYDNGSHNMVACISCHLPVNADPVTFLYHKAHAGIVGAYQLITKTYAVPLNATSHLALHKEHMADEQCTQCHNLANREITPSEGIIINHEAHTEKEIICTACHNRVAHPEADIEITTKNPVTGERAAYHADFMSMTACFRCHTLTAESPSGEEFKAPGTCATCHPSDFDLKPANHDEAGFYPAGHADLAMMEVDHATGRPAEDIIRPIAHGEPYVSEETTEGAEGEGTEGPSGSDYAPEEEDENVLHVVAVEEVDYCATCHVKDVFCMDCHGMEMPHPEEFKTKSHPEVAATQIDKCELCHKQSETFFCDSCHHGTKVEWTYDPAVAWQTQHASAVVEKGVAGCLGTCHDQQFCVDCHTKLQPLPSSHKAADWLHKDLTVTKFPDTPAVASASHAIAASKSVDSCDVCHGPGGTESAFCKGCHGMEIPHPDTFKTNHVSGRNTPQLCANCHQQQELCSDCHHEGAKNGVPWTTQHPITVASTGAGPCFEKCHENKQFCVDCHTTLNAVPTSHTAADWTRRTVIDQPAKHQVAYKEAQDSCDYCHGEGGVTAQFCQNCHKLEMPHPDGFDEAHKADFEAQKYTKDVCVNCHTQYFCDSCHHPGAVQQQEWRTYHPNIVKKDGAQPCFECHEPTYCSYCHVRL
jgi:hypothetical protein